MARLNDPEEPERGSVYPPRNVFDVMAYPLPECVAGMLDYRPGDPEPGENRSPAFRWGWRNRARDCQLHDDGFDDLRRAAIVLEGSLSNPVIELASYRTSVLARHEATL